MRLVKIIVVVAIALGVVFAAQRYIGGSSTSTAMPRGGARATSVNVTVVGTHHFETRIEAIGTAYAEESVDIAATVSGRLEKVLFKEGATAEPGDILVRLEDAEQRADVEEARADLDEQKREFTRIQALRKQNTVSQQELDSQRSAMEEATARLAAAQARLKERAIVAPFHGVLGLRRVSPGALLNVGTVITTLDDIDTIKAQFSVPETLLASLRVGQTIEASSVAWAGETFRGVVTHVDTRVDSTTRAITIQARIANPDRRLRPGMLLTVGLISHARDTIGIPEKALLAFGDTHHAFVVKTDQTVEKRQVRLGEREFGWVEIEEGLREGETIALEGLMNLKDGAPVQVAATKGDKTAATSPDRKAGE